MDIRITIVIVLLFIAPVKQGLLQAQEEWTLRREKEGITIYTRTQEDNPLKEYRFSVNLEAPIDVVYEFLSDVQLHPEWVYQCSGLNIIDEIPGVFVTYHTSYDIPWPASDRDLVAKTIIIWEEDSNSVRLLTEETNLAYDLKKDVVRMPDYKEDAVLERMDDNTTLFCTEGYADPGGGVPPWLVNMFMVDGIYDSATRIREITEKR